MQSCPVLKGNSSVTSGLSRCLSNFLHCGGILACLHNHGHQLCHLTASCTKAVIGGGRSVCSKGTLNVSRLDLSVKPVSSRLHGLTVAFQPLEHVIAPNIQTHGLVSHPNAFHNVIHHGLHGCGHDHAGSHLLRNGALVYGLPNGFHTWIRTIHSPHHSQCPPYHWRSAPHPHPTPSDPSPSALFAAFVDLYAQISSSVSR